MNHTANYQLSQWVKSDQVKMDDFNADNAKIDAALGSLAQTAAAHAALLPKLGNCQIEHFTYAGTGKCGQDNPTVITFSRLPLLFLVGQYHGLLLGSPIMSQNCMICRESYGASANDPKFTWKGNSVSFYTTSTNTDKQFNSLNSVYHVFAFYAEDAD